MFFETMEGHKDVIESVDVISFRVQFMIQLLRT